MITKFIGWANIIFFGLCALIAIANIDILVAICSIMFVWLGYRLINGNEEVEVIKIEMPNVPGLSKKTLACAYIRANLHKGRKVLERDIVDMLQVSTSSATVMVCACLYIIKQEQQEIIEFEKIVKNLPAVEHKCPPDSYEWE